jgi:hypothetical protein
MSEDRVYLWPAMPWRKFGSVSDADAPDGHLNFEAAACHSQPDANEEDRWAPGAVS